ncbi:hypothetical protein MTO96_050353 [Rhipicephalus appendiculatus]
MGRKTDVSQLGSPQSRHVFVDVREGRGGTAGTVDCTRMRYHVCSAVETDVAANPSEYGSATPEDQGQATTHEDSTR